MKISPLLSLTLSLVFALPLAGQGIAQDRAESQLQQAGRLRQTGKLQQAVELLLPMVQPNAHALPEGEAGVAWNLLGSTYQDMEQYNNARRCYETAIAKLKDDPAERLPYAAAMDNLGSVELAEHQLNASKAMRIRALRLYQSMGDHAGVARTASNLATVALAQGDWKASRRNIAMGFEEAQLSTGSDGEDWAAMYAVEGSLAMRRKGYRSAATAYQKMIDRYIRDYGPNYSQLGTGYELLGQAEARLGENRMALSHFQQALALDERVAPGRQSIRYLQAEVDYARALRASGSVTEATILEEQATSGLQAIGRQQCSGCTISAQSLR